ncbi:hypothetical protein [Nonomuraea sp. NPDC023979]|uniref:hypothetical protein n=1 Tax=Nonomuraea sp. NPDC023979 TaxID=3154796 RepID=UPI0033F80B42
MSRWRNAWIAASIGMAASAAFVAIPAKASTFNLVVDYSCTRGIAGDAPVTLRARVQIPTSMQVGGMLDLGWTVDYTGIRRFASPGYFPSGAEVSLVGNVKLEGAWNGVLQPHGSKAQKALEADAVLDLPEGISSEAHMTKAGVIKLTPQELTVDFVPPAGEEIVNNHEVERVTYGPSWKHHTTEPEFDDIENDLHTTSVQGDVASITFLGTGFEYIGRRMRDVGRVEVTVDGVSKTVDPTKDTAGEPVTGTQGNTTLWRRDDLPYGRHTVTIKGVDADKPVHLDAFKLLTGKMINPPTLHRATCVVTSDPDTVEITVGGGASQSPSQTPTDDPDPSENPTPDPSKTPVTPTPTPPNRHVPWPSTSHVVVVVPGSSKTPTPTAKTTPGPTATNYKAAQVDTTPLGGVDTGEAPEQVAGGSYALIAGGSLLLMGSAAGGLLVRRRRAGHAGGTD